MKRRDGQLTGVGVGGTAVARGLVLGDADHDGHLVGLEASLAGVVSDLALADGGDSRDEDGEEDEQAVDHLRSRESAAEQSRHAEHSG